LQEPADEWKLVSAIARKVFGEGTNRSVVRKHINRLESRFPKAGLEARIETARVRAHRLAATDRTSSQPRRRCGRPGDRSHPASCHGEEAAGPLQYLGETGRTFATRTTRVSAYVRRSRQTGISMREPRAPGRWSCRTPAGEDRDQILREAVVGMAEQLRTRTSSGRRRVG
jgi:hypothetical protein